MLKKEVGRKWLCTQVYFFPPLRLNMNFGSLTGKSPLENELQLYSTAVYILNKD